jgi:nucleotide-binding universal stress UspA family protein
MDPLEEIVVGTDGSPGSRQALRFAAHEAAARGCALRVVHAYDWRVVGAPVQIPEGYAEQARQRAESVVQAAVDDLHAEHPDVLVTGDAVIGGPGPALIAASADAAMVVVGSRGRGGFASLLLGSISQQVATHSKVPVVVVRGPVSAADGPVIAGVDGSPDADHALGLAFEFADRHGLRVVVVRAYAPVVAGRANEASPPVDNPQRGDAEREALQHSVLPWCDKFPQVPVESVALAGNPAEVLARMSNDARVVVVGSRGRGGFASLVLGSVGVQLLHHAHCPVLIDHSAATRP